MHTSYIYIYDTLINILSKSIFGLKTHCTHRLNYIMVIQISCNDTFDVLETIQGHDRCPLCTTLINRNQWREHLMGDYPCPNNSRNKVLQSKIKELTYTLLFFTFLFCPQL